MYNVCFVLAYKNQKVCLSDCVTYFEHLNNTNDNHKEHCAPLIRYL